MWKNGDADFTMSIAGDNPHWFEKTFELARRGNPPIGRLAVFHRIGDIFAAVRYSVRIEDFQGWCAACI